jgi:L-alanine-DL-glutamate epimerase-like enolase superfamily enzyme
VGLSVSAEVLRLTLREPFRIARSDHDAGHAVTTVIIELRDHRHPGVVGIGEGYPDRFYGETAATILAVLPFLVEAVGEPELSAGGRARAGEDLRRATHNGGAKCALDIAHDLAARSPACRSTADRAVG